MTRQEPIYKISHCDESSFSYQIPLFDKDFRVRQWSSSRWALSEALSDLGITLTSADQLEIDNYHILKLFPEIKVSLTHHEDYGAALVSNRPQDLSVGIDLESRDRKIKDGIKKFFINERDQFNDDLLELWVAKEAAFKAVFPYWKSEKPLVLTDLWVGNSEFGHQEMSIGSLEWFNEKNLVGATAILKEGPTFEVKENE